MELYYKDNETILYFNSIEKSENNTSYYKIDINTYTNNNIEMFGLFNNKIDEKINNNEYKNTSNSYTVDKNNYITLNNYLFSKEINIDYRTKNESDNMIYIDYKLIGKYNSTTKDQEKPDIIFKHEIISIDPQSYLKPELFTSDPDIYDIINKLYNILPNYDKFYEEDYDETDENYYETDDETDEDDDVINLDENSPDVINLEENISDVINLEDNIPDVINLEDNIPDEIDLDENNYETIDIDSKQDNIFNNNVEYENLKKKNFNFDKIFNINDKKDFLNINNLMLNKNVIEETSFYCNVAFHAIVTIASILMIYKFFNRNTYQEKPKYLHITVNNEEPKEYSDYYSAYYKHKYQPDYNEEINEYYYDNEKRNENNISNKEKIVSEKEVIQEVIQEVVEKEVIQEVVEKVTRKEVSEEKEIAEELNEKNNKLTEICSQANNSVELSSENHLPKVYEDDSEEQSLNKKSKKNIKKSTLSSNK